MRSGVAAKVFISYRRDDSGHAAGRVHDRLEREFGSDLLFMDVDAIPLGVNFIKVLREEVAKCDVLLALIGPNWLDARDEEGNRRLDNPEDYLRIEIATALQRDIPVIPILLDRATMPKAAQLPTDLEELAVRNGLEIRHASFRIDMDKLVQGLKILPIQSNWVLELPHAPNEDRIKSEAIFIQGARGGWFISVKQVHWGWIGAIAALMLTIGYFGINYIPAWWRGSPEIAMRDPALSIKPASGQSFRDRLANGEPCPLCPEMVVAPAGSFTMGSPPSELGRNDDEIQVPVTIDRPFAVGKFAITFDQWDACVAGGGCNGYRPADEGWGRGNHPVISVNWADAKAYAAWLSRKTGMTYRLLSEAEREYVTRAGTTTPFWWGSSISPNQANYDGRYAYADGPKGEYRQQTVPVGSFEANPWGLLNVHGNVREWTEDCWNDSNQGNPGNGNARTTGDCSLRVVRGGSWSGIPRILRAASRGKDPSDSRGSVVGFRLARTLNP
jgi:formylglycine-generating enzyme required for sulfatase activity